MTAIMRGAISFILASSLALCIIFALGASNADAPDPTSQQTIVTIDLKAVLMDSLPGKAVQVRFRGQVAEAKADVEKKTALLQSLENEMSSLEFAALSDPEKGAKRRRLEREKLDLKFLVEDTEKQLERSQEAMMATLTQEIKTVIERVAKKRGYDLVLIDSPPGMLYATGLTDVSAEVLSTFESEWLKKVPEESPPE